jgi:hypothetical protein
VLAVGLRLILLLAVLIQYTPLRTCAFERVAVGSNCHDWGTHADAAEPHEDEPNCGSPADEPQGCVCEQPKVDGQHDPHALKSPLECAHVSVAAEVTLLVAIAHIPSLPDPDPHPRAPLARQLPLLL